RRRHTRFSRDWSSDVCSSDLRTGGRGAGVRPVPVRDNEGCTPGWGWSPAPPVDGRGRIPHPPPLAAEADPRARSLPSAPRRRSRSGGRRGRSERSATAPRAAVVAPAARPGVAVAEPPRAYAWTRPPPPAGYIGGRRAVRPTVPHRRNRGPPRCWRRV